MMKLFNGIGSAAIAGGERDRLLADVNPLFLFIKNAIRAAAIMSLVMVLADAWSWDIFVGAPMKRLEFVIWWAVMMAAFDVIQIRYSIFLKIARFGRKR